MKKILAIIALFMSFSVIAEVSTWIGRTVFVSYEDNKFRVERTAEVFVSLDYSHVVHVKYCTVVLNKVKKTVVHYSCI